jgi:site-specific DNA recombinase
MIAAAQPDSPRRAATYRRVSTVKQKIEGHGLDTQERKAAAHAERIGAIITHDYEDDDSGKLTQLPGLDALLAAARRGEFDIVIADKHDRLARNRVKQWVIEEELDRYGVEIEYVAYQVDRRTAAGRLHSNIMSDFAEYERELISERMEGGKWTKARKGQVVGGNPPLYGYRFTRDGNGKACGLVPDPATAPILRRIFRELVTDSSTRVAERLTAEGIATPRGKTGWRASTIREIARNPAYEGYTTYGRHIGATRRERPEGEWVTVPIEPIVTAVERQAALDGFARRGERRAPTGKTRAQGDPFAVRGVLRCGVCGRGLGASARGGYRYYQCVAALPSLASQNGVAYHRLPAVNATAIEAATFAAVQAALSDEATIRADMARAEAEHADATERTREQLAALDAEIATRRRRLDRATLERLDVEKGSEADASLERTIAELSRDLDRFSAERASLAGREAPGLSAREAASLRERVLEVQAGMAAMSGAELQTLYGLLRLRGHVTEDPEGAKLGRHHFRVRWEAIVSVPELVKGDGKVSIFQPNRSR